MSTTYLNTFTEAYLSKEVTEIIAIVCLSDALSTTPFWGLDHHRETNCLGGL